MVNRLTPDLLHEMGGFPHNGNYADVRRSVARLRTVAGDIRPQHLRK
jgi:ribosomal protein L29